VKNKAAIDIIMEVIVGRALILGVSKQRKEKCQSWCPAFMITSKQRIRLLRVTKKKKDQ